MVIIVIIPLNHHDHHNYHRLSADNAYGFQATFDLQPFDSQFASWSIPHLSRAIEVSRHTYGFGDWRNDKCSLGAPRRLVPGKWP